MDHCIFWNHPINTMAQIVINKQHVLGACELKLEVFQELSGGKETHCIGTLIINLSEYADSGVITRRYLLDQCKFNSRVKVGILHECLSLLCSDDIGATLTVVYTNESEVRICNAISSVSEKFKRQETSGENLTEIFVTDHQPKGQTRIRKTSCHYPMNALLVCLIMCNLRS